MVPVPAPSAPRDVVCVRARAHGFAVVQCCRDADEDAGARSDAALYVVALADDGVIAEIVALTDPSDPVGAFVDLIVVNHGSHDLAAWGYLVGYVGTDRPARLLAGMPHRHELDWIDRIADDHGVELVDWLIIGEGEGVSAIATYGLADRWLEPDRCEAPAATGPVATRREPR